MPIEFTMKISEDTRAMLMALSPNERQAAIEMAVYEASRRAFDELSRRSIEGSGTMTPRGILASNR